MLPRSAIRIPPVIVALAVLGSLLGWAIPVSQTIHPFFFNFGGLGTDWMAFYDGARWFFDGRLSALFHGDRFTAYLNATHAAWLTQPMPYRPWVYPPSYLLLMLPFGLLPFGASYVVFQLASAALLAGALWIDADRPNSRAFVIAAALLGPAAAINATTGQNAFLIAALLVGGMRLARAHPAPGGAMLGLLTIKPQFWFLIPVALVAQRQWKALFWSLLAAAGLALASLALFGIDLWLGWVHLAMTSLSDPHSKWTISGRLWGDSIYACAVIAGGSAGMANLMQAAGTLFSAVVVYRVVRLPLPGDQKIAVLLACTFFGAPHSSIQDTVLLMIAAALWIAEVAQPRASLVQWTIMLLWWLIVPLGNPPIIERFGLTTPVLIVGLLWLILKAAREPKCSE